MKKTDSHISTTAKTLLDVLGQHIAKHPKELHLLLIKHGVKTKKGYPEDLLKAVFYGIENKGKAFHQALAKALYVQEVTQEDAFNMDSLMGKGAEAVPAQNSGITVGSDPVSAIAGAIGSVANIFGNHQNRKTLKMQARSKTLQSMLAYKTQQEQQTAAKQAANQTQHNQEKLFKMAGIAAALGVIGWLAIRQTKK